MGLLSRLRDQGLRVGLAHGRLTVAPRSALTDAVRTTIRVNRDALIRELGAEARSQHAAVIAARDASMLAEFTRALEAGALQVCCNCRHFSFASDPTAPGQCAHYAEEVMAFVPFQCRAFARTRHPIAPMYLPESVSR